MAAEARFIELPPGYVVDPLTGAWVTLPWPGDPALPYEDERRLQELPPSLGPQVILWGERMLVDAKTRQPWRYTPGQKRFLHMWYAVERDGQWWRWKYRSGVKRGAKGTGKDPLGAAIALTEFAGPVHVVGWRGDVPLAVAHNMPLVQIGANSQEQAKDLIRVAANMVSADLKSEMGIEIFKTQITRAGGGMIELLTTTEASNEGDPATAIILNETHHFTRSNQGHELAEVGRRNVGKSPVDVQARILELTNAHQQGEDSVAERSFEAWQAQQIPGAPLHDILYDSVEAEPSIDLTDVESIQRGLDQAYKDAPWADKKRLLAEIFDARTSPAETIRYYLNGLAAAEEAWVDPRAFDECARPDIVVDEGEKIALFLDCSKSSDATTLSGCRLSDGHIISLGGWRRPHGDRGTGWLAPREVVDAVVREAFDFYDVVWFGVDPSPATDDDTEHLYWMPTIDKWHRDFQKHLRVWATPGAGGHSVLFDMRTSQPGAVARNRAFTEAAMQTVEDIEQEHTLTHDGDPMLRLHVHNARRRPNQWGVSLGKVNRSSTHLVDYAVTMVGARMGRTLALRSPKVKTETGRKAGRRVILHG